MSQFYDQASLVMVPSGYKNGKVYSQKPLSTDGELTFTRASNATRVGPDGLIQKVRTNLLTYSNDFSNAAWGKSFAALTGGQSGYDGTNNAWKLQASGSTSCYIQQGSFSVLRAHSIYAKAGTYDQISIINGGYGQGVQFDLTSGTIVTNSNSSIYSPTITSVGSGWYKISLGIQSSAPTYGFLIAPQLLNGGGIVDGEYIYIQNAQTEYNDIATDYIATTTSARSTFAGITVDGTSVPNVPRLDYSGGCPSLLLEPTATALNQFSEQIDNAYWTNANCTVTANQTASPSGYVDAELVLDDTSNNQHVITRSIAVTSGNKYTASFFLKAAGYTTSAIRMGNGSLWTGGTGPTVEFDLVALTGTVVDGSGVTFTIEDYGNGWRRCSVTGTCVTSGTTVFSLYVKQYNGYIGNGTSGIYAWGANITATGYVQSYIPTLGSAVTRLADSASKTGISSLIGQTEGTAFIEFSVEHLTSGNNILFNLSDGTSPNSIYANWYEFGGGNRIEYAVYIGGALVVGFNHSIAIGTHKLAFAYKANDFVAYVDGVAVGSDTSGSVPATSRLSIGSWTTPAFYYSGRVSQALLFKTRLTNAQLAELTTL